MPINHLYDTWMRRICELRPGQRITQVRNFAWLIVGIYQSRSVHLSRIAGKIPGTAKLLSITRRLSRLLDNAAIDVREWYEPIARQWLQAQWSCLGEIRLIVMERRLALDISCSWSVWLIGNVPCRLPGPGSSMYEVIAVRSSNWPC